MSSRLESALSAILSCVLAEGEQRCPEGYFRLVFLERLNGAWSGVVHSASLIFICPSTSFTAIRKGLLILERILAVSSRYIRVVISPVDGELVDLSRL